MFCGVRKGWIITVQYAHGDAVTYSVASVEISAQGKWLLWRKQCPTSCHVVLYTYVGLGKVSFMVMTKSQACRLKQSQLEQSRGENKLL